MSLRQKSLLSIHPGVKWEILPVKRKMIVMWMVRGYLIGAICRYLSTYEFVFSKNCRLSLSREIFLELVDWYFYPLFEILLLFFCSTYSHIYLYRNMTAVFNSLFYLALEGLHNFLLPKFFKRDWWFWKYLFWNLASYLEGVGSFLATYVHRFLRKWL